MALCCFAAYLVVAVALAEHDEPIITDRPDFTESAVVVRRGRLQIENGVTWDDDNGQRSAQFSESLVRYGVADRFEARLEIPNWVAVTEGSGWGPTAVGFKWQVGPTATGFDAAWIAMLGIPSGSIDHGIRRVEPSLSFCLSRDLGERLSVAGMINLTWPAADTARTAEFGPTISFAYSLAEKLGAFLEYAGTFAERAQPENLLHLGLTYQPQRNLQWDVHAAVRLDRGTRRTLFGLGLSYRF
ncbi:MAG: hypothetical protein HONBIEJF_01351 [Fimbriimonadaceae bacterium]|nr:hypothetical protein [Fimbriimonadaceae bacterium]